MDLLAFTACLAQAPDAGHAAAAATSLWSLIVKGGVLMIPIGACSLLALTLIVERSISLKRANVMPPRFIPGLRDALARGGTGEALSYCERDASPIAGIFCAALRRLNQPLDVLERHIEQAGQREVFKLRRYLRWLSVIAALSPLLGLLGTVFGMIRAFQTVAASSAALGRTELLAQGIYEALVTTAAGLIVAIPCVVAYHGLTAWVDRLIAEMDALTMQFIEEHVLKLPAGSGRPPSTNGSPAARPPVIETRVAEAAAVDPTGEGRLALRAPAQTATHARGVTHNADQAIDA